jgi:hypothetical protein
MKRSIRFSMVCPIFVLLEKSIRVKMLLDNFSRKTIAILTFSTWTTDE